MRAPPPPADATLARAPWPPPDPATINQYPEPPKPRAATIVALVGAALFGLAVVVAGTVIATGDDGDDGPDEWDPRVADIAADVERIRELDFEHPIEVQFLAEDDFVARVTSDEDVDPVAADEAETTEAMLRATGLIEGDVDLAAEADELAAAGILGFYDPGSGELVVRGDELDPLVTGTLVHELTHALQDQHFDLTTPLSSDSAGAYNGARALIEADASWVEDQWVADLSDADADEYARLEREFVSGGDIDDIPRVLVETTSFPYIFGPLLHATLVEAGGIERVDEAFDRYPTSDEQILFPASYLEGDDPAPVDLDEVAGDADGEVLDGGEFGAFTLFQVLATRLDHAPTMEAVEGWGGDAYRVVERGDATCVDIAVAADSDADLAELVGAFEAWVEGLDDASVVDADGHAVLTTCDPGDRLPSAPNRTEEGAAFDALAASAAIATDALQSGFDADAAQCMAAAVIDVIGVDRLAEINDEFEADPDAALPDDLNDAMFDAVGAC